MDDDFGTRCRSSSPAFQGDEASLVALPAGDLLREEIDRDLIKPLKRFEPARALLPLFAGTGERFVDDLVCCGIARREIAAGLQASQFALDETLERRQQRMHQVAEKGELRIAARAERSLELPQSGSALLAAPAVLVAQLREVVLELPAESRKDVVEHLAQLG